MPFFFHFIFNNNLEAVLSAYFFNNTRSLHRIFFKHFCHSWSEILVFCAAEFHEQVPLPETWVSHFADIYRVETSFRPLAERMGVYHHLFADHCFKRAGFKYGIINSLPEKIIILRLNYILCCNPNLFVNK